MHINYNVIKLKTIKMIYDVEELLKQLTDELADYTNDKKYVYFGYPHPLFDNFHLKT